LIRHRTAPLKIALANLQDGAGSTITATRAWLPVGVWP
jgi:hypothetical protein